MVSLTVTRRPFYRIISIFLARQRIESHTQSPVALAMSSPTFLGERPRGPILGARAEEAPTSPPVARRWLEYVSCESTKYLNSRINLHHLNLIGVEFRSCSSCKQIDRRRRSARRRTHLAVCLSRQRLVVCVPKGANEGCSKKKKSCRRAILSKMCAPPKSAALTIR